MTAIIPERPAVSDYEEIIKQIKDVVSVRIAADLLGEISEIHVLAGAGKSPKQIVRDIESALIAKFGISIDHKRISVVQLQDHNSEYSIGQDVVLNGTEVRPKVVSVTAHLFGRNMEVKVQLEINGDIFEGNIAGPVTSSSRLRFVSQAAVLALQEYLKNTCNLVTEDVVTISIAGQLAVTVGIALVTDVGEEKLLGAAFINHNENEAVVKATLAAINRRFSLIMS